MTEDANAPSTLESAALHLCKALQIETGARPGWWVAVDTVAYRLKAPAPQLHDAIYFAKMNGWLGTGGVPVHSLQLRGEGQLVATRARLSRRRKAA
jgi:hypothetical protein